MNEMKHCREKRSVEAIWSEATGVKDVLLNEVKCFRENFTSSNEGNRRALDMLYHGHEESRFGDGYVNGQVDRYFSTFEKANDWFKQVVADNDVPAEAIKPCKGGKTLLYFEDGDLPYSGDICFVETIEPE